MTLIITTAGKNKQLQELLNRALTLRLYSNNAVPDVADTAASYTEITGGGYAAKPLTYANWIISGGVAIYPALDFNFTSATDIPGTAYGYYLTDVDNEVRWVERFEESVLPFTVANGSLIRVRARIEG
jgi:hypothetical protein